MPTHTNPHVALLAAVFWCCACLRCGCRGAHSVRFQGSVCISTHVFACVVVVVIGMCAPACVHVSHFVPPSPPTLATCTLLCPQCVSVLPCVFTASRGLGALCAAAVEGGREESGREFQGGGRQARLRVVCLSSSGCWLAVWCLLGPACIYWASYRCWCWCWCFCCCCDDCTVWSIRKRGYRGDRVWTTQGEAGQCRGVVVAVVV